MHRLDMYIYDIEPRIRAICEKTPVQEEPSLQVALAAYGWILLDSWIAWKTLRFLLRDTVITDKVNEKWYQTPSSYYASQLIAIWNFDENTLTYIEENIGNDFKYLIDRIIQPKRNASAHFSQRFEVKGQDIQDIQKYYEILSKVFMFYELMSFVHKILSIFIQKGYEEPKICFMESEYYDIDEAEKHIEYFLKGEYLRVEMKNKEGETFHICINNLGCYAGKEDDMKPVLNDNYMYSFFEGKAYYLDVIRFVNKVQELF